MAVMKKREAPVRYLARELDRVFGIGYWGLKFKAQYVMAETKVIITATGRRKKPDGSRTVRHHTATILLPISDGEYERLAHNVNTSMTFPFDMPPLS